MQIDKKCKNAKTQKEQNMQKEQQNKKFTFASDISTSYLFFSYIRIGVRRVGVSQFLISSYRGEVGGRR